VRAARGQRDRGERRRGEREPCEGEALGVEVDGRDEDRDEPPDDARSRVARRDSSNLEAAWPF
jgi:hypothetical protein